MKTIPSLTDKVAVVTGASRGVGAGIATLLGEQGATVYVTGRTTASKHGTTPGTISEAADRSLTRYGDYFSAELRLVQAQLNERLGASAAFCEH